MSKLDRYMLVEYTRSFTLFFLVLLMVFWVNRAISLLDRVIGDGHSIELFATLSLLSLPNMARIILPIAIFAATLYVTYRLIRENEMAVLRASGISFARLARPTLIFGAAGVLVLSLFTHVLIPKSSAQIDAHRFDMTKKISTNFLRAGEFIRPKKGITLYMRRITPEGILEDLFISDQRNPPLTTIISAPRARLITTDSTGSAFLMFNGALQRFDASKKSLSIIRFQDLNYNLAALIKQSIRQTISLDARPTSELLAPSSALLASTGLSESYIKGEGFKRIAYPFLALAAALIGFGPMVVGTFSRFGLWRQVCGGAAAIIATQTLYVQGTSPALIAKFGWPPTLLGPLGGLLIGATLIWFAQRTRRQSPLPKEARGA